MIKCNHELSKLQLVKSTTTINDVSINDYFMVEVNVRCDCGYKGKLEKILELDHKPEDL